MGKAFLGVIMAALSMEAVVRSTYSMPLVYEPDFGLVVRPGLVRWGREGHATSHWTRFGLRGRAAPDLSGEAILVLGNSVTEALQVDDEEVFTTLVERLLREAGVNRRVLNAGRSGVSAAEFAAFAERNLRVFRPRWTVVEIMPEDLGPYSWSGDRSHFSLDAGGHLTVNPRPLAEPRHPFLSAVANESMLVVYGAYRIQEFRQAFAEQPPLFLAASSPPPEKNRRGPATETPEPSASMFVACTDPNTGVIDCPIEAELDAVREAYQGRVSFLVIPKLNPRFPGFKEPLEMRIDAHCSRTGMSCVNIREGYAELASRGLSPFGFSNTGFNQGHMNRDGHRLTARLLSRELERLIADGLL